MRFVFLSAMAGAPWGGSEELWSRAALRLCQGGHKVAASVTWWPELSPKVGALAAQGVELYVRNRPLSLLQRLRGPFRSSDPLSEDIAWLRSQRPHLTVISQGGNQDGWPWMKICRDLGLKFVPIIQCNYVAWWPDDEGFSALAASYQAARKVFFVSRKNLEMLECQIGARLQNSGVIWNPCNVASDAAPTWPARNHVRRLACVARLEPAAKGQDLLLQVLACPQWRDRPVEIHFYGGGPSDKALQGLARYLQLTNVHFHGHVEDVRLIWEDNHLLVLPSRYEGLPLALMESMWCQRPAVVTDVGGNAEMCLNEETGFVAAAPTVKFLAEALERAWLRRADWQDMGLAARARAEQLVPKDPVGAFCQQLLDCV
jgi:glycosyltransferase involved in cell wall biosynthesis